MYQKLLDHISKHISLSPGEAGCITSHLSYKELPAKTELLREGQPCRYLYYVETGALRAYCLDKQGRESTIMFAVADWWITDMYCFLNRKPSMTYIETLEPSSVFALTAESLDRLYGQVPRFERFMRILMQNAYTREQLRSIGNLTLSAEERYDAFLSKYPHIAQAVTQKQIASYLGITPEFLSTIRKKKAKGIS